MGARTLEASLRLRLLAFLALLLVAVGAASLGLMWRALDAVETDAARGRATEVLHMMRDEAAEGGDLAVELHEVLHAADEGGIRIVIRSQTPLVEHRGAAAVPDAIARLRGGECVTANDESFAPWKGCAVEESGLSATVAVPVGSHRALLRALAVSTLGVVAVALLGAAFAVRMALRKPLASVTALAAWSGEVMTSGARPKPAPGGDAAEVARLAGAFDAVVERLFDALERERANSAHIAHELRTPLTALRAELEAIGEDDHGRAARMLADVKRLSDVIDSILVLSAPRGARPAAQIVNVADVAREVAPAGAVVEAPDEALIEGDARLIELALQNLVDNARKHGRGLRAVRVERTFEDGSVEVSVLDDGPGLDEAARARMFDRYWRASEKNGGAGLGLALVRAVAELHEGTARAEENASGRGLRVSMRFPRLLDWHER